MTKTKENLKTKTMQIYQQIIPVSWMKDLLLQS